MKPILLALAALPLFAQAPLTEREKLLLDRIDKLEQRIAALESMVQAPAVRESPAPAASALATTTATTAILSTDQPRKPEPAKDQPSQEKPVVPAFTINTYFDGYYAYNFNRPANGVNQLRAFDLAANGFGLNQTGVVIESLPDVERGRRIGGRLDLQFGQATETLQGSSLNEPRPQVYRHIFQAYGTYIAPVGQGLRLDFGKWASGLGLENNYTKDSMNYSRSYWFNFLPYYHMGLRATYPLTQKLSATYWLVNGANQTEDFNDFKSQAVLLNYTPVSNLVLNVNYYNGQEQRRTATGTPDGRTHYLNSYFTWNASKRLTLVGEGNYAIQRIRSNGAPERVTGGTGYAQYRFTPRFNVAGRFAYLSDRSGWFTGTRQWLRDFTATATYDVVPGFQMRWEVRRDWSNQPFFLDEFNRRQRDQVTALMGVIWWFGGKQGAW
jgi:hypothetical protein